MGANVEGVLSADQQLTVLARVWGPARDGYVFLPWVDGDAVDARDRRRKFHEGPAYEWPGDRDKIREFLEGHEGDDVFFAPSTFEITRRVNEAAQPERVLWADIDAVDVHRMDEWRPTICWESSPGRYQGVWLLRGVAEGASWAGKENQRLTVAIGADPSGWDTSQLLRVPGRPNYKPEYRQANGGKPLEGKLLWTNGPRYSVESLADLPAVVWSGVSEGDIDLVDGVTINEIDRAAVWGRVRLKVSTKVREYINVKNVSAVEGADRSDVLWQIERDLADAGCTLAEIVAVVRPTVWNKFDGRNDELKRLKMEAAKAINESKSTPATLEEEFEVVERGAPDTMGALMGGRRSRPRWLVGNVWSQGGVGFISGVPKSYKSWVALDLAISVATGRPFLGTQEHTTPAGGVPVLYVQEEDSEPATVRNAEAVVMGRDPELHPWGRVEYSEAAGVTWRPGTGNLSKLYTYIRRGFRISDPGWQVWMDETIEALGVQLVVIDTLGTTAGEVDLDKQGDVQNKVLRPIRQISAKRKCAFAVVHHNRKAQEGGRAGQQLLGSTALHAWVEDALYITGKESMRGGWAVSVERESKSAPERRFKIQVPRMGTHISHTTDGGRTDAGFREDYRVWWDPTVVEELADVGTETVVVTDTTSGKSKPGAPKPGALIARIINGAGGANRPIPFKRINENHGQNPASTRKQLDNAIKSGLIKGDESTGYQLV